MTPSRPCRALLGLLSLAALAAAAPAPSGWTVRPEWVRGDEEALAGDALRGRGSATPDEARAADFVAGEFKAFGLQAAPGQTGYLQKATVIQSRLSGPAPVLTVGGHAVAGAALMIASGNPVEGTLAVPTAASLAQSGAAAWLLASPDLPDNIFELATARGVKLLIIPETEQSRAQFAQRGTRIRARLADEQPGPALTVATVPATVAKALAAQAGAAVALSVAVERTSSETTNAIGFLPGTDPKAGTILVSAHLDHLGVRPEGTIMHGANDDASGTTAVIELARALAAGQRPRRSVLFVCYGSEEIGEFGSRFFAAHPPVPIAGIVANIEFEMIGAQDPHLPKGALMMTGFERSTLGPALAAHGALLAADPYPSEHFFERSDNYQLALAGVVAHTLSGWAEVPTYHQPTDTIANLDLPFMTRAIQSLVEPVRWLASGDFTPAWTVTGRPHE